jgi:hypothetical protein
LEVMTRAAVAAEVAVAVVEEKVEGETAP